MSSKSMHAFLSNLANRQTDRQTSRAITFTSSIVGGKVRGLSRLSHRGGISVVSGGGRVRGEDLNLSAILMYIVSMISSI